VYLLLAWSRLCVETEKQITCGVATAIRDPALREMIWPVVQDVASLAKAFQVPESVVGRVMIKMRSGKNDARGTCQNESQEVRP
jgi:hypothetical protein